MASHSPNEVTTATGVTAATAPVTEPQSHHHHAAAAAAHMGNGTSVSEASGVTLRVRRMGDDAIEFTVSRTHATLFSRADIIGAVVVLLIIVHQIISRYFLITTANVATSISTQPMATDDTPAASIDSEGGTIVDGTDGGMDDGMSYIIRILMCVVALGWRYASRMSAVREESLLVVDALGVQKRTVYWSGAQSHRFIDKANISQIIINEGITMCRVVFYVAIITCPTSAPDSSGTKINNNNINTGSGGATNMTTLTNRSAHNIATSSSSIRQPNSASSAPFSSPSAQSAAPPLSSSIANGGAPLSSTRPKKVVTKPPHHQSLVLAFDHIYPRLSLVKRVYQGSRAILYGEHFSSIGSGSSGSSGNDTVDESMANDAVLAQPPSSTIADTASGHHQHTA